MEFPSPEQQLSVISKGTDSIISEDELLNKLKKSFDSGKPLRIKAGFDPTAPDLHLGHCVLLKKLRDFQDLGHTVLFLIGDFTAQIGDPTGKTETRPPLSDEEIKENAKTYEDQVFRMLRRDRTEIVFNSRWMHETELKDFFSLTSLVSIARLLEREDFSARYKRGATISLKEFLYPVIQAYDSVELKNDIEIGGVDQTFNILLGRDFHRHFGIEPQVAVFLPILEGLDGVKKMSKSIGNYIGINEAPEDIYGKVMSVSDDLMWRYYELLTDKTPDEIEEMKKSGHPMECKKELAFSITSFLSSEDEANSAREDFETKFSERQFPDDAREVTLPRGSLNTLLDMVSRVSGSLKSRGEAKRLISQGGLNINGEKYTDFKASVPDADVLNIKIGKKEFVKVRLT